LGDALLEKETVNLPDIIEVLGTRPFGMNEVMEEYLSELKARDLKDKEEALKKEDEEKEEVDAAVEDKEEIIENKDEKKEEK
tara:strand:- start:67 stop:312 length:246 start_codon:yes stop_codon:yes gene_type:complete